MKCSNCQSELLEGAKFCTSCGTPVKNESQGPLCATCQAPLLPDAKFCTTCGTPVASKGEETAREETGEGGELSTVKQRIFWNIQRGEVACHINEAEFLRYDSAQGLIVNDGTTAYVKANGKVVAEIHGGTYDFVDPEELKKILESRQGGAVSLLSGLGRFLINALIGRRVKDKLKKPDQPKRRQSLDQLIESLKRKEVFSLQLKLDKNFSLVFGEGTAETDAAFRPMTIRTKHLDLPMGVRAIFHISDFEQFSKHYLSDSRVATTRRLAEELQPMVAAAVQGVMNGREVESNTLPQEVVDEITARLMAQADSFHGLTLERVAEVVASNEDLERLRGLARELYLSEKELDYLRRTNDFRNRLAAETNSQAIAEAQSELQLYQGLQEVNKDRLLAEDELDKFYTVLSREKRIRDAQSEDQVEAAMAEIAKTEMLREEDLENLRQDIAERGYQRGQSLRLMQLKDQIEFEKVRMAGEGELAVEQMRQTLELQDMALAGQRKVDAYADERRRIEHEHARAERQDEIDLDNAEMDAQLERLRKLKEMEREDKAQAHTHEMEMERVRQEKLDKQAQLSAEQLMAIGASENMNSEAAHAFAESFSAGKNAEQIQQAADARLADAQRHQEQMMEMMRMMQQTATTMTGHLVQEKDRQRDEYRSRLEHQEARIDHTQDSALEYATRNNQQQPQQPQQPQSVGRVCPNCGTVAASGIRFCAACGREL